MIWFLLTRFQSTLPMGEQRLHVYPPRQNDQFQSTLPMGGATGLMAFAADFVAISIHTPHGGSDTALDADTLYELFQSTLPMGGATVKLAVRAAMRHISIHTPHGGSDLYALGFLLSRLYFNPHSPWGERRYQGAGNLCWWNISIHTPHGGSDREWPL